MNRIKILREEKSMLQGDLAQVLGVTQKTISNYENETRDIPTQYLITLANFFGVSTDYLLGKTDVKNSKEEAKLDDIYMHLAKEAQDLKLNKDDVDFILEFYKKHKK